MSQASQQKGPQKHIGNMEPTKTMGTSGAPDGYIYFPIK